MDEFHLLRQLLIRHEDIRLKPYYCSEGKLTIGCGRNLEDIGLSKEEALFLLSMLFNLGITRLDGFKKFLSSMSKKD
jgi:lysozyme